MVVHIEQELLEISLLKNVNCTATKTVLEDCYRRLLAVERQM